MVRLISTIRNAIFDYEDARRWSNTALKDMVRSMEGYASVINVSGWRDEDKQGRFYREYFPDAVEYLVTGYDSDTERSATDAPIVDLMDPNTVKVSADVAFTHTVLEHVPNPHLAVTTLARIARTYILTVVPVVQGFHFSPGNYGDYFRFMPHSMAYMLEANGFQVERVAIGPRYSYTKYMVCLASRSEPINVNSGQVDVSSRHQELIYKAGAMSTSERLVCVLLLLVHTPLRLWRRTKALTPKRSKVSGAA